MPTRADEQKVIARFGKAMQSKLDVREYKGRMGWRTKEAWELYDLATDEMKELKDALLMEKVDDIKKEAADVGNRVMMIHDVIGRKKV